MSTTYKHPGVYNKDIIIRTRNPLQTGVPGFVGFADETGDLSSETRVTLAPEFVGSTFSRSSDDNMWYDETNTDLVCCGPMQWSWFVEAQPHFDGTIAQDALKNLYRRSQKRLNKPVVLYRKDEFNSFFINPPAEQSYLADAINGFFDNGGKFCYVVHGDITSDPDVALVTAMEAGLSALSDIDLIAIPDCMKLPNKDMVLNVQRCMLAHCIRHADRFALLDSLGPHHILQNELVTEVLKNQRREIIDMNKLDPDLFQSDLTLNKVIQSSFGALYFPWIHLSNRLPDRNPVPPCGHIAGIYARSDQKSGVYSAPANEEVLGVFDLESDVSNNMQNELNPEGINCLRAFPGRGIRIWGARTLCHDESWRYINVRRLILAVSKWIDINLSWASFEPNTPLLWVRITRELTVYLTKLWQSGALAGDKAAQAFYVKCDTETNPPDLREAGQVVTHIGIAPMVPAEFIIVRVIQHAGTTEVM